MARKTSIVGTPPLDLLDQGVALLRAVPATAWGFYLAGNGIYLLGALYFLADMSRNPFALNRLPAASLGLTLLYLVHRTAQHQFCRFLHAELRDLPAPEQSLSSWWKSFRVQARYSPWSLLLLPLASVILLPLAWCMAYHQSLVCRGDSEDESIAGVHDQVKRQAQLWPMQNHLLLSVFSFFIFFAFINVFVVTLYIPQLLKSLLGIHTPFTDSYYWIGSSTYLAVLFALTYLATDPFLKAVYVLRCHAGQCLQSGEDLRIHWRRRVRLGLGSGLTLLLLFAPLEGVLADAVRYVKPTEAMNQSEAVLDRAEVLEKRVSDRLQDPRYAWRMPKERVDIPVDEQSLFARTAIGFGNLLKSTFQTIGEGVRGFVDWMIERLFEDQDDLFDPSDREQPKFSAGTFLQLAAWGLVGLLICSMAIALYRRMKYADRQRMAEPSLGGAVPDVDDEATLATDLPEDEWLTMGRNFLADGDLRRAMRAFFLAGLASCSRLKVIEVARGKTNRDYLREMERKSAGFPRLLTAYQTMRTLIEPRWYGTVPVKMEDCQTVHDLASEMRHHEG